MARPVFQEPSTALDPVIPVGKQLAESVRHLPKEQAKERLRELMQLAGFSDTERILKSYPHELSGGQLQRIVICMALAPSPKLLIADEPTTALDVTVQAQVMAVLKAMTARTGTAVLLITHNMALVAQNADRMAVMKDGQIVEHGPVGVVLKHPQHEYTKKLLAAVPKINVSENNVSDFVWGGRPRGSAPTTEPMLAVKNLSVYIPKQKFMAVKNVSFDLRKGEMLALVGESGSGKTTIARALVGLVPKHAGEVLGETGPKQIQMVFQDPYSSLNPRSTVSEILGDALLARGEPKSKVRERMLQVLDLVQLPQDALQRFPHAFSGGQRQRIGIARALMLDPKILLCDEVTSALDVSVQAAVLDLLRSLRERLSLSMLFISHDLAVVSSIADRVIVLKDGEIAEQGPVSQIFTNPQSDYTKELLAAVPRID
jgi:ABC-type glutathione transport system ATPase component